jgi:cupin 2 domain-containing protein
MKAFNLFAQLPEKVSEECFQELVRSEGVKIERIVSHGHASPPGFWYDQELNEWVVLLKGSAGLAFEDGVDILVLRPGDAIHIRAHEKHRVEWTDPDGPTIWLAVHY